MATVSERKDAALKVFILWSWLAYHIGSPKKYFPFYEKWGIYKTQDMCPWYETSIDTNDDTSSFPAEYYCTECPLNLAGLNCISRDIDDPFTVWCRFVYSKYSTNFNHIQKKDAKKAAMKIADIALNEYKNLKQLS